MPQKIINFFDKHRLILILFILLIISLVFTLTKLYVFKNYNFSPFKCTSKIDDNTCLYKNTPILVNPNKTKEEIFKEYAFYIDKLKQDYQLPDFNYYTAYYYAEASNIDYNITSRNKTLNTFFNNYVNSYNLKKFYQNNSLFYEIFYPYKLNLEN